MIHRTWILISLLIAIGCWACSSSPETSRQQDATRNQTAAKTDQPPPPAEPEEEGPVPTGMIDHWRFDEGSGSVAKDASGGGDGTIHEASWTKGHEGDALHFSGPQTYVRIPHRLALNPRGPFEISLWAYIEERPLGYAALIEKGSGYGCSFRLILLRNGHIRAAIGNEHLTVDSSTAPSLNQWHKIELIYTGQRLRLKIDGQEVAGRDVSEPNMESKFDVTMGRGLVGKIDEVKIVTVPPRHQDTK